jgi:hemerythrin-like domain-containing protein
MPATPTDILMAEHRIIEKVIAAMDRFAGTLAAGGTLDRPSLEGLVPFMRQFADGFHHGKEEDRLFPALVSAGLPAHNGPVQVMCSEHETGRHLVGQLEEAIATHLAQAGTGTARTLAEALTALARFYGQHIWKEDNVLFPMAARVLDDGTQAAILAAFAEVTLPHERHQALLAFADGL